MGVRLVVVVVGKEGGEGGDDRWVGICVGGSQVHSGVMMVYHHHT